MFAATADQLIAERVRQDFWWLRAARWLVHPDRQHDRGLRLWLWLLWPIGFPVSLVYAQALPYLLNRALPPVLQQLPWVTDRELLGSLENLFKLCHELLRVVGKYSLARGKVAYWLEELDEQIDTLEFVRAHGGELDAAVAEIRAHHARGDSRSPRRA
jgi:hypothetical protein